MTQTPRPPERRLASIDAALAAGAFDAAAAQCRARLRVAPDDLEVWLRLVSGLSLAGRLDEATAACDAGLGPTGRPAALLNAKAHALRALSRVADADALWREVLATDPANPAALFGRAALALERGDWEAVEALVRTLDAVSGSARPEGLWLRLGAARGRGDAAGALVLARRLAHWPGLTPDQQADAELQLGQALDALDQADAAFAAVARGKALQRAYYARRAAGREAELARLQRLSADFDRIAADGWPAAAPLADGHPPDPVFILGFPRSGTTLLEQVLAGHPDLAPLEEAPTLAEASAEFLRDAAGLRRLAALPPAERTRWRGRYWAAVRAAGLEVGARRLVDKAPAGTATLPLIARLFPQAQVLFAIRNPHDVVLSCFRQPFQMNALTYAFTDLGETARVYDATQRLAALYRTRLPLPVCDARHEALVADFDGEVRRILAFIGLAPTAQMADFAAVAQQRSIRTPSAQQVRGALTAAGVGRAERLYGAHLAPVRALLAPWAEAFGYPPSAAGDGT